MKKHTVDAASLKRILIALSLLVVAIIALDSLPGRQTSPEDTASTDVMVQPPESTAPPETTSPTTTETETTLPETTVPETEPLAPGLHVTILGTCAPGSPLGTTAYGSLNATMEREGTEYFFQGLAPILTRDDLTLAANACVFTASGTAYACASGGDNASVYAAGSVEMVTLDNPVFEGSAATDTYTHLTAANVAIAPSRSVQYVEKDGVQLAIYTTVLKKAGSVEEDLAAIRDAAAEADYVLVYYWGVDTYSVTPEEWLRYNLHKFADAGASLIVGSGCSDLRPMETYGDATIAYSLGNLLDGSSFGVSTSAILSLHLAADGTEKLNILPCGAGTNRWQPTLLPDGNEKTQVLTTLKGNKDLPLTDR